MVAERSRTGPIWLPPFLKSTYFTACKSHAAGKKNERNFFCITCHEDSLCQTCVDKHHRGSEHHLLQVRKSSHHDSVRIRDITCHLNVQDVQPYVINDARIVYLNERPQGRYQKGDHHCEGCLRSLMGAFRFCSLGCKLCVSKADPSTNLALSSSASTVSALIGAVDALEGPFVEISKRSEVIKGRPLVSPRGSSSALSGPPVRRAKKQKKSPYEGVAKAANGKPKFATSNESPPDSMSALSQKCVVTFDECLGLFVARRKRTHREVVPDDVDDEPRLLKVKI